MVFIKHCFPLLVYTLLVNIFMTGVYSDIECNSFRYTTLAKSSIKPALIYGFCGMKGTGVFLVPLYVRLVHRRVTPSIRKIRWHTTQVALLL